LILAAPDADAQVTDTSEQTVDFQFWTDYNYSAPLTKKFSLAGDIGFRGFISNYDWNLIYIRPGVRHNFNKYFGLAGSLAYFSSFLKDGYNLYEFRVTVDANISWPDLKVVNFSYRARIENRTFFSEDENSAKNNWRVRLLISLNSKRFHVFSNKRSIYFQVQYEPFQTLGGQSESVLDISQTRLHAIFGHRITDKFGYDMQYIRQNTRISSTGDLQLTQNILRVRIYHRIVKRDEKRKKE
jgi:hypothetical protein